MIATKLLKEIIQELEGQFIEFEKLPFTDKLKIAINFQRNAILMKAFIIQEFDLYEADGIPGALETIAMLLGAGAVNEDFSYIERIAIGLERIVDNIDRND